MNTSPHSLNVARSQLTPRLKKTLLCACCLGTALMIGDQAMQSVAQQPHQSGQQSVSLTDLVAAFQKEQGDDPQQSRVTADEIIAGVRAYLGAETSLQSALPPIILDEFRTHKSLPAGSLLELVTYVDPGGEFVFEVRDVYLRIPLQTGMQVGIPIRKRYIASRTLTEEIARVERELKSAPALPGRYRLDDRLRALKERSTPKSKQD